MDKKAIIKLKIGKGKGTSNIIWPICEKTHEIYAKKINVDYISLTTEDSKYFVTSCFYMQKLQIIDFLKVYNQVCAIDCDMFITPNALDIFKIHPKLDTFYGMDEGYTEREKLVQPYIDKHNIEWERSKEYNHYKHYNGGCYIYGKDCDLRYNLNEYISLKGYEENFINYVIQKNKVKNINMERKWNKICSDNTINRRDAYFIHHAGPGFVDMSIIPIDEIWNEKAKIVQEDWSYFYD